jgi:kynurenine formamidase
MRTQPSAVAVAQAAKPFYAYEIVELTHVLDERFPFIPVPGVTFPFSMEPIATLETNGVAANAWKIHEHIGTQIDAPNHFAAGGVGLEALLARDLIVPVVVIDFRAQGRADRDIAVTVEQIKEWEASYGRIPDGTAVALYTGWDRKIGSAEYIGLDGEGHKHFPGFSPEALRFLVEERQIWGVGVDTLSFDPGRDDTYAGHRVLLNAGRWALEALANLDRLPPTGATLVVGAPRVAGATGGPARVLGLVFKAKPPDIAGRWQSEALEPMGIGGYLHRDFRFEDDRWRLVYTLHADATGELPQLRGEVGGTFEMPSARGLTGAFPTEFRFLYRRLEAMNQETAKAMTAARCGARDWEVGRMQDVTARGCTAFRVSALADCPVEYDLVDLHDETLRLGARTAGPPCGSTARAETASAPVLVGSH